MPYSKSMSIEERRLRQSQAQQRYCEHHPERYQETLKLFKQNHPKASSEAQLRWFRKLKETSPERWAEIRKRRDLNQRAARKREHIEAIEHYGGQCYCCGERIGIFLALDHIGGGGNQHRKALGWERVEGWAKRNGWPPILRVACHNCNFGAHLNGGFCPHLTMEMEAIVQLASQLLYGGRKW